VNQKGRRDCFRDGCAPSAKSTSYRSAAKLPAAALTFGVGICLLLPATLPSQEPPRALLRELAAQGSRFERERQRYTYRREFRFNELDRGGRPIGSYEEVREVLFSPKGERIEQFVGRPHDRLQRIGLTEEDFRDLREVQPFVLTEDTLWRYRLTYKGMEDIEEQACFVFRIQPRQVLDGQRVVDGLIWVSREYQQIIKVAGKPLPQIHSTKQENLFAQFATIYQRVDKDLWFPVKTVASDILPFRNGAQRVEYTILYKNYQRFQAESSVTFGEEVTKEGVKPPSP
jgi:hypothetical protein